MNSLIEEIFADFKVDNKTIPVSFKKYDGKSNVYITYQNIFIDGSYSADDEIQGYIDYYDIDIYSKSNYMKIVSKVKEIMKDNGFMWQPSRTSEDMFEDDTGYWHKTLCFAIERNEK